MSESAENLPPEQHPIVANAIRENTFKYDALPGPRYIRLLELYAGDFDDDISVNLQTVSLDSVSSFEALSYTWGGDSDNSSAKVLCGGRVLTCGPNLYQALRYLRRETQKQCLWADALCINQQDDNEKSQQVQIMTEIYSAATRTLIWLGPVTKDTAGALGALKRFGDAVPLAMDLLLTGPSPQNYGMLEKVFGSRDAPQIRQIGMLIKLPWFHRKWIVQELIRSADPVIILGKQTLPWDYLERFIIYLAAYKLEHHLQGAQVDPQVILHSRHANFLTRGRVVRRENVLSTLVGRTVHFCSFSCWDDRDHVISLLGLANDVSPDDVAMFADYSRSAADLFVEFAKWSILRNSRLEVLSMKSWLPVESTKLPSWAPDISEVSKSGVFGTLLQYESSYRASRVPKASAAIEGNRLSLSGRIVDIIAHVGEQHTTSSHDPSIYLEDQRDWLEAHKQRYLLFLNELESVAGFGREEGFSPISIGAERAQRLRALFNRTSSAAKLQQKRRDFLRAVLGDSSNALSDTDLNAFQEVVQLFRQERAAKMWTPELDRIRHQIAEKSPRFEVQLQKFGYRHFFRGDKGRLGWAPRYAEKGDLICVFEGAFTPHVIRQAESGCFLVVGDCYIHGFMLGEAEADFTISAKTIVLE